jgi:hypothetical protein
MFTIQRLNPSGDAFLLRWHGRAIAGYAGPLHHREEDRIHNDPDSAYAWALRDDPDELAALNQATFQLPTFQLVATTRKARSW